MYIVRFKIPPQDFSKQVVSFFILEGSLNLQIIEMQDQDLIFQVEFKNFDRHKIINNFKKIFPDIILELIFEKKLDYEEWKRTRLKSLEVGIFKFKPIFEKSETDNEEFIYLDTLVGAFGIDQHPTTVICLEFLNDYKEEIKKSTAIAVDFGTGNGILSL
ncbi:MAG: 50S ribosomal protein L11 methyltransferase, partial [bacterium]